MHTRIRLLPVAVLLALTLGAGGRDLSARQVPPPIEILDDTTLVQEVTLLDGTTLMGRVVRVEGDQISIRTLGGLTIDVRRGDVRRVRVMEGRRHGRAFWPDDPAGSRLFLGPTARVPGNGRGYFGVYELFVASFGVGLGDRGMISGGVSLIPGLSIGEQVYYIAPKIKVIDAELVEAAAGVLYVKPGTSEDDAGAAFAAVTVGNELGSFSGALSVPFGGRADFAEDPFLMLGGELRATRRLKFVSENWVVPGEEGALLSFGARILGERMSVEAAVITSTEGGFLPLVSFSLIW